MQIKSITVKDFKKVQEAEIVLDEINVLVGGNNSGKSSVLQAIHFSIMTAVTRREFGGVDTFPSDYLLYCPTSDFTKLRHREPYGNWGREPNSKLIFSFYSDTGEYQDTDDNYSIVVYKGRNTNVVGCYIEGDFNKYGNNITDTGNLFSVYVPGLAGVPQKEEFRTLSVIRRGFASGDANLYLRNVILEIKNKEKLPELQEQFNSIFENIEIKVDFNPNKDTYMNVTLKIDEKEVPLELAGTGMLQCLQLFSYATLFKPTLLLLDEPDSHMHPSNQSLLADTLRRISEHYATKIILSTHSKHLVESLCGYANFVWMQNGEIFKQGGDIDTLSVLLDIGALSGMEKFREQEVDYVILTEDSNSKYLKTLLKVNEFDLSKIAMFSYRSSSYLQILTILLDMFREFFGNVKIIVHRDRDFMNEDEVSKITEQISVKGAESFITAGSDIESYFYNASHISRILGVPEADVNTWLQSLADEMIPRISDEYRTKRDQIRVDLYKGREAEFPSTSDAIRNITRFPSEFWKGKTMLRMVQKNIKAFCGREVNLNQESEYLISEELSRLR